MSAKPLSRKAAGGLLLLAASLMMIRPPSTAASGAPVPGSELKKLRGLYTAVWKGHPAKVKIEPDGTLRAISENRYDSGRWKVKGDRLCVAFRVWTKGRFKCGRVHRRNGWYEGLFKHGKPRLRFRR